MIKIVDIRSRIGCAETREIFGQLDNPPEIRATKTAEIAKEYREHTEQLLFAAELDGELVGFIGIRLRVPDEATIRHIAVHRDHRRQGIGNT